MKTRICITGLANQIGHYYLDGRPDDYNIMSDIINDPTDPQPEVENAKYGQFILTTDMETGKVWQATYTESGWLSNEVEIMEG